MNPRILLTLGVSVCLAGSAAAQSTGQSYPYRATAPESYRGSSITVPVPGISPNTISNAARGPAMGGGMGSSLGGSYAPPFLTSADLALRFSRGKGAPTDNKAHIWLRVPENAEVWVEGVKTRQTGEARYYYSPPLTPGKEYAYRLRVRWQKDGKPVEETQRLLVHAGASIRRDFTQDASSAKRGESPKENAQK